jgi:hypothetical protein
MSSQRKASPAAAPNLGRHEFGCKICAHPQRDEIERDFVSWMSPTKITAEYKLRNRATVYRHAHAFGLFSKRGRNLRAALERLIEQVADVPVNASAVVQAVVAYAKINSQGELVEPSEQMKWNDVFTQMSIEELDAYAKNGTLPSWFTRFAGATAPHSPEGDQNV